MFYLFMVGKGEGCDYTIGCNMDLIKLKAINTDMAFEESKPLLADHGVGE